MKKRIKKKKSEQIYELVCSRATELDLLLQSGKIKDAQKQEQVREVLNELTDIAILILNGKPFNDLHFKNWLESPDLNWEIKRTKLREKRYLCNAFGRGRQAV